MERAAPIGTPYNGPRGACAEPNVRWGPRFTLTAPAQEPPLLVSIVSFLGRPLCGDECRADVRWVRAELFNRRPQAGTDGQESSGRREVRWRSSGRPGSGSVHYTTLYTLAEQSRCHVGPTILCDRPRPGSPTPRFNRFLLGPATLWRRVQSRGAMGAGGTFPPSPAGRSPINYSAHFVAGTGISAQTLPVSSSREVTGQHRLTRTRMWVSH